MMITISGRNRQAAQRVDLASKRLLFLYTEVVDIHVFALTPNGHELSFAPLG